MDWLTSLRSDPPSRFRVKSYPGSRTELSAGCASTPVSMTATVTSRPSDPVGAMSVEDAEDVDRRLPNVAAANDRAVVVDRILVVERERRMRGCRPLGVNDLVDLDVDARQRVQHVDDELAY